MLSAKYKNFKIFKKKISFRKNVQCKSHKSPILIFISFIDSLMPERNFLAQHSVSITAANAEQCPRVKGERWSEKSHYERMTHSAAMWCVRREPPAHSHVIDSQLEKQPRRRVAFKSPSDGNRPS